MRTAKIMFHGVLAKQLGRDRWDLAVSSVGEACHAVNILSGKRLFQNLIENDKRGIKYKVLINHRPFRATRPPVMEEPETIMSSELVATIGNLETIDVVPVMEGADDIGAIVLGVVLIAAAFALPGLGVALAPMMKAALIVGGLGLVAAGVINLLSSPPVFEDFREIAGGGKTSYLFSGPQNVVGEGGPVPILYGRAIIGSQTISASYDISERSTDSGLTV